MFAKVVSLRDNKVGGLCFTPFPLTSDQAQQSETTPFFVCMQKRVAMVMKKASLKGQIMMIAFLVILFIILFVLVFLT